VVTLHSDNPVYWGAAVEAVNEADDSVKALGRLAANLTLAAGGEHPEAAAETARDLGYGSLDGPYRAWLRELAKRPDLAQARQQWRETVRRQVRRLARQEIRSAGPAAVEGRTVVLPGLGETLVDAGRAELWFGARLEKVLGPPPRRRPGQGSGGSS
jgi:CRISPR system Cascade subunit CasA